MQRVTIQALETVRDSLLEEVRKNNEIIAALESMIGNRKVTNAYGQPDSGQTAQQREAVRAGLKKYWEDVRTGRRQRKGRRAS